MTEGIRGMGGILLAVAAGIFADRMGITGWELFAVPVLVGLGALMVATGRLKGW